ncbi:MAG: hypothetical protein AAGA57_08985 [Planctomycetota bacterium]
MALTCFVLGLGGCAPEATVIRLPQSPDYVWKQTVSVLQRPEYSRKRSWAQGKPDAFAFAIDHEQRRATCITRPFPPSLGITASTVEVVEREAGCDLRIHSEIRSPRVFPSLVYLSTAPPDRWREQRIAVDILTAVGQPEFGSELPPGAIEAP